MGVKVNRLGTRMYKAADLTESLDIIDKCPELNLKPDRIHALVMLQQSFQQLPSVIDGCGLFQQISKPAAQRLARFLNHTPDHTQANRWKCIHKSHNAQSADIHAEVTGTSSCGNRTGNPQYWSK